MSIRPGQAKGPWVGDNGGGGGGTITGSGTPDYIPLWATATSLTDSWIRQYTDGGGVKLAQISTPASVPGSIGFAFADENVWAASIYKEATTQDIVVTNPVGTVARIFSGSGHIGINSADDLGRVTIGEQGPVECYYANLLAADPVGTDLGRVYFAGYSQDLVTLGAYAGIVAVAEDTDTFGTGGGAGSISLQASLNGNITNGLRLIGDPLRDLAVELFTNDEEKYAFFDAESESLSVGLYAVNPPRGILNLVSNPLVSATEQACTNVGNITASSGTFTRSGNVFTRKDVGRLTDDGVLPIVPGPTFVGVAHVWASTSAGGTDHVHQANFTFDGSTPTPLSIFHSVGNVVNTDTDGKLCILVSSGVVSVKNRLGATVNVGYVVDYYDNPSLAGGGWGVIELIRDWRSVAMDTTGNYQTAVAFNDYIYRTTNKWSTWSAVGLVKGWYSNCMSSDAQYQYASVARVSGGGYVYRSTDYGATWAAVTTGVMAGTKQWYSIVCDTTGQYVVACVNGYKIYYSSDYGATWAISNSSVASWQKLSMTSNGATVFALNYGASDIKYSTDYGATWSSLYSFGSAKNWDSLTCDATGTYILAGEEPGRVYRSADSGASWAIVASLTAGNWHEISMEGTGQYATVIQKGAAGTVSGIWESSDYAATFTQDAPPPYSHTWWGLDRKSATLQTVVGSMSRIYIK
jgi:hypothetical protein